MTAMARAELETFVEQQLRPTPSALVAAQVGRLADRLRPDEQLLAVAVGSRRRLLGRQLLVAATDQRLLLVSRSSWWEGLSYDALVSVTDAASTCQIALVTRDAVHTLTVVPAERAVDIVAAVAARIGQDRVHHPAGAAEARWMRQAFIGAIVSVCLFIGGFALNAGLHGMAEDRRESRSAPGHVAKGECLDIEGRNIACTSSGAEFVVLGARKMRGCPSWSPELVEALATTQARTRDLSRWCVGSKEDRR